MTLLKKTTAAISWRCAIAFGLMLLTVTAVCVQPAHAADSGIYLPASSPFGLSYDNWSAKWWQWVYSIPRETKPQYQGIVQRPEVTVPVTVDCSLLQCRSQQITIGYSGHPGGRSLLRRRAAPAGAEIDSLPGSARH